MSNRQRTKGRKDTPRFAGIPHPVMDNDSYQYLSGGAVRLLNEFARQYNGRNNGNLTAAHSILKKRRFGSKGSITRAVNELLAAELITCTRTGRFTNPGGRCALYALNWKPIDKCPGKDLDVNPTTTPPRQFSLENKNPSPQDGLGSGHKQGRQRARDDKGKFVSNRKQGRLRVVT